jgi:hypothetical protein
MSRAFLVGLVVLALGGAIAFSGGRFIIPGLVFQTEAVNPVTHLRFADASKEFSFAIVSDRTGGHRANIFSQAVEKLNLMQPQFVVSVGDLVEGTSKSDKDIAGQWKEFDGYVAKLTMPFFYVAGNHDLKSAAMEKFWEGKLGRRYYHFVYRDVLFLILNTEDPPGGFGSIGKEQVAYVAKTLADNAEVRWTLVFLHRPIWSGSSTARNGWADVERHLAGRNYTVFAGHVHRFQKFVRQGMNYYQLATTGGSSLVRGPEFGEFDHITWITMKSTGPTIGHLMLDAILTEDLKEIATNEPGSKKERKPTHPVLGKLYFDGTPAPGAVVYLDPVDKSGMKASGVVEADGSFRLTTYKGFDGAVAGDYKVSVTWKDAATGKSLLPKSYAGELRAKVQAGDNRLTFELKQ